MTRMHLEIVTAEGRTYSGGADYVVAPGEDGQLTVLPSHAPLITSLLPGELRFADEGAEQVIAVHGGFMEVNNNSISVLANSAEPESAIDLERAEAAVQRARERLASQSEDIDMQRALSSLRRAQVRARIARRARERTGRRNVPQQGQQ